MEKSRVKGDVFLRVISYVIKKWGKMGLAKISVNPDSFKAEIWYSLKDFTILLQNIKDNLAETNESIPNLGRSTIVDDERWKWTFKDMDPEEVFSSTSRQNAQYQVGEMSVVESSPGFVRMKLELWVEDEAQCGLWAEFYRGRLQGVLDLTGSTGNVEQKACNEDGKRGVIYAIFWM